MTSRQRGEDGYNPAHKCDMTWSVICHNTDAVSLRACLDQTGDETSFAFQGFGETSSGPFGQVSGKPGTTKGAQVVLVSDVDWMHPRCYVHRHRKHCKHFSMQGNNEVYMLLKKLEAMVVSADDTLGPKAIFSEKPHSTWDNFFWRCHLQLRC